MRIIFKKLDLKIHLDNCSNSQRTASLELDVGFDPTSGSTAAVSAGNSNGYPTIFPDYNPSKIRF